MMRREGGGDESAEYADGSDEEAAQGFLGAPRQRGDAPQSICSFVSFWPQQAMHRMLQCFGYSRHALRMQSGRTVVVGKELAQGGFSFVYKAQDAETGDVFALKKMLCQTQEQMDLAKQEIQMHKSFMHAHLMPLSDYAVVPIDATVHEYYLLFPYMENGTLREMIDLAISTRVPIPERVMLDIFLKVCRAVGELHARSPPLAHRDIKPENVMFSRDMEPVLTDFGSATIADVTINTRSEAMLLQEQAAQMCSMPYRAPELYDVASHKQLTSKTDVWSLGCLLYAMAFGYSPFECSFTASGEIRIVDCSFLAVLSTVKFPKAHMRSAFLLDLIQWMLTQDPSARPSVFDVIERLHSGPS